MAEESPVDPIAESTLAALPVPLQEALSRTPARLLVGRAGASYRTSTLLQLRADHAAARDAVHADLDLERDLGAEFVHRFDLFEVRTRAADKQQYLMRPDLGRQLDDASRRLLVERRPRGVDLQVVIGDGLSAAAVVARVPPLLPLLEDQARSGGWSFGRPFFVRHCRVGVMNDVGDLLDPAVVVLLIGERPGLATAESLSAYMAYRPRQGDNDGRRNLISNIHGRGVLPAEAAGRILALAAQMRRLETSGPAVKEELSAFLSSDSTLSLPPRPAEGTA